MKTINLKQRQKVLLSEHYNIIIERINMFKKEHKQFVMKDLLDDEKYNYYYIHLTKGILLTLIDFGYIEIVGVYNGYKNFIYSCKKEIKLEKDL